MNSTELSEDQLTRLKSPRIGIFIGLIVSFITCILYLSTISFGLNFHDSAELALRADKLGASHSPGSPLHSIFGWLFIQSFIEPIRATNLLSAFSMGISAGILAMFTWQVSGRFFYASMLLFACSFQVWGNAVITELYGLSTLFSLLSIVLFWQWRLIQKKTWLIFGVLAYCLALAVWFANLMLAPVILLLIIMEQRRVSRDFYVALALIFFAIICIAFTNIWLAGRLLPYGPDIPNSFNGIFRYMSGAMHDPLDVSNVSFIVGRILDHSTIFLGNFIWIGIPFGLIGLYLFVKRDAGFGIFLASLFLIQMTYFSIFGPGDYYSMVILSYAIFSFWIVYGVVQIFDKYNIIRIPMIFFLFALPMVQLILQLPSRIENSQLSLAQEFIDRSFSVLPKNALIIAGWNHFTALEYGQKIQNLRPDLTIILPASTVRHYGDKSINNYLDYVLLNFCKRPILTNKVTTEMTVEFDLLPFKEDISWFILKDKSNKCFDF